MESETVVRGSVKQRPRELANFLILVKVGAVLFATSVLTAYFFTSAIAMVCKFHGQPSHRPFFTIIYYFFYYYLLLFNIYYYFRDVLAITTYAVSYICCRPIKPAMQFNHTLGMGTLSQKSCDFVRKCEQYWRVLRQVRQGSTLQEHQFPLCWKLAL